MKLALFTLMSCLIALSWQQQHHHYRQPAANPYWPLSNYYHQQQQQLPYYYQDQNYNHPSFNPYYRGPYISPPAQSQQTYYQAQQQQQHQVPQRSQLDELKLAALLSQLGQQQQYKQQQAEDESQPIFIVQQPHDGEDSVNEEDLLGRAPAGNAENRGFLWPAIFAGGQILSTSTSYKFVTSTITSTNVISCIVSASFYGGSTQTCRRKRAAAEIEADEDQMPFDPSPVNSVMPSVVYDELSLNRLPRSADVVSSFEHPEDRPINTMNELRVNRALTGLFGSTITSTVTTYSISTTASKKTVSIGSSLSCLPSGYSVC